MTVYKNELLSSKQNDILVIDVGSGTQDVLVYQADKNIENCPKLVMPSSSQLVGKQIRQATQQGQDVYLYGYVMGGGACSLAVKQHLEAGLKVYATKQAAYTINDNLHKVREIGIEIVETTPDNACNIWMGDVNLLAYNKALGAFDQPLPSQIAVAVQDHGFSDKKSNRIVRFSLLEEFIAKGGFLRDLIFTEEIPAVYTRMNAVREAIPGAILTDTGTAAILGIIADATVKPYLEKGMLAINIGNSHTLVAAIRNQRVYGLFEHHTELLNTDLLHRLVKKMQNKELTNDEIFNGGGHGAAFHSDMGLGWDYVAITGPQRSMAKPLGWHEVSPYGDMMLTGCFGILAGLGII